MHDANNSFPEKFTTNVLALLKEKLKKTGNYGRRN